MQIFVKDNQEGTETTQIDYISFIGSPLSVTNMNEFKRVSSTLDLHVPFSENDHESHRYFRYYIISNPWVIALL